MEFEDATASDKNPRGPNATTAAADEVNVIIAANACVVFSKTVCPHCKRAKACLDDIGAEYKVVELDSASDPAGFAAALVAMTGRRTVPNVFVGGQSIGGADDTLALHAQDKLAALLDKAGAMPGDGATKGAATDLEIGSVITANL